MISFVHVITIGRLREFWEKHPQSKTPLESWHKAAKKAAWKKFEDVKVDHGAVDRIDKFTVFDIGGNKWRLVAAIHYNRKIVFIRHVLTHEQYSRGKWKE
jgi:mRNA interferase HigB